MKTVLSEALDFISYFLLGIFAVIYNVLWFVLGGIALWLFWVGSNVRGHHNQSRKIYELWDKGFMGKES